MAVLTILESDRVNGALRAPVAAAGGGDKYLNTGREIFIVNNGGGAPINVQITPTATVDGQAAAQRSMAIAAGAARMFGPYNPKDWNDATGYFNIGYSGVTTVTVEVMRPAVQVSGG